MLDGLYTKFEDQPRKKKTKTGSISTYSKCRRCRCRSSILLSKNLESIEIKYRNCHEYQLEKLFSQISVGGQKEMWQQVKKSLNMLKTTVQLFRKQKRTKSIQSWQKLYAYCKLRAIWRVVLLEDNVAWLTFMCFCLLKTESYLPYRINYDSVMTCLVVTLTMSFVGEDQLLE